MCMYNLKCWLYFLTRSFFGKKYKDNHLSTLTFVNCRLPSFQGTLVTLTHDGTTDLFYDCLSILLF